jgi:hypothetical protein
VRAQHSASDAVLLGIAVLAVLLGGALASAAEDLRLALRDGWAIQSSARVTAGGEALSRPGFATAGWHPATPTR